MLKKIISFVLICLFLVGAVSCGGKTEPTPATTGESPTRPIESKPNVTSTKSTLLEQQNYLELTAQELLEKVLDQRLVQAQREEMWKDQFKGKRVKWLGAYSGTSIVYSGDSDITIEFIDPAKTTEKFNYGDVVWVTGTLDSYYGYSSPVSGSKKGFKLRDGAIVSLVMNQIWSHDWTKTQPHYGQELIADFVGVDNQHVYFFESVCKLTLDGEFEHKSKVKAYDKSNGYFAWEETIDGKLPLLSTKYPINLKNQAQEILPGEMQQVVISKANGELLAGRQETIRLEGLNVKIGSRRLEFYDITSEKLLLSKEFAFLGARFLATKETLFVLDWTVSSSGVDYAFTLRAYQLH